MRITLTCVICQRNEVKRLNYTDVPEVFSVGCKYCKINVKVARGAPGTKSTVYVGNGHTNILIVVVET